MKIDVGLIESIACNGGMTFETMQMVKAMAEELNRARDLIKLQEELIKLQEELILNLKQRN